MNNKKMKIKYIYQKKNVKSKNIKKINNCNNNKKKFTKILLIINLKKDIPINKYQNSKVCKI